VASDTNPAQAVEPDGEAPVTASEVPYELLYAAMRAEFAKLTGELAAGIPPLEMREPEDIAAFEALCNVWFAEFLPEG
jgi:hypothetical protein